MQIMSRKQSFGQLQNIDFCGDWLSLAQVHAEPYQWPKLPGFSVRCMYKTVG